MLESHIRERRKSRDILLMTHMVIGYPSLEESLALVETMVEAGVDLMELQIPFSEPIADGPVILKANQDALQRGVTVADCLEFGREAAHRFPIPFLFMTYANIAFQHGMDRFADAMADGGLRGAILPDLPPEEGSDYLAAMERRGLAPIFIYAPTTTPERMAYLSSHGKGFIYCVARKGVTGADTSFSGQLDDYLARARAATELPLAVGFGVKSREDVSFLTGRADIAVVGTETIRVMEREGLAGVKSFIRGLR